MYTYSMTQLEEIEIYEIREENSKHKYECAEGKFENDEGEVVYITYNFSNDEEFIVSKKSLMNDIKDITKDDILEHYEEIDEADKSPWLEALEAVLKAFEEE